MSCLFEMLQSKVFFSLSLVKLLSIRHHVLSNRWHIHDTNFIMCCQFQFYDIRLCDYVAKIYARHPCACFRVLSTGLQINFLGKVQTLNRFTGIYMGTCFNRVVIPHSERTHSVAVEPTLFLCKLIPIHQFHNASTSSISHTSCIHSKNHGHHRTYFRFLNDTVLDSVSACLYQYVYVCACPEIYAIIHREEKR